MRPKSLILLVLALGCGLVASIGINQVLANRDTEQSASPEMTPVLVAVTDVAQNEVLNPQVVRVEQWPKDKVPEDALTKVEDIVDRVTRTRILKDEPIREGRLGAGETADQLVPKGYRVLAVRVDSSTGVANLVLPGSRVDVLCYFRQNRSAGIHESGTKTILEDVKVFAVNDVFQSESADGENKIVAKTISLLLTPEQAEKITLATELGKLRLTMRSPGDDQEIKPPGSDLTALFDTDKANRSRDGGVSHQGTETVSSSPGGGLAGFITKAISSAAKRPDSRQLAAAQPKGFQMMIIDGTQPRVVEFSDGEVLPRNLGNRAKGLTPGSPNSLPQNVDGSETEGSDVPELPSTEDAQVPDLSEVLEGLKGPRLSD